MSNQSVKVTQKINKVTVTSSGNVGLNAGGFIQGNLDITGNLDVTGNQTITGDQTITGSTTYVGNQTVDGDLTVGANSAGHDFKAFGATSSKYIHWDASQDKLIVTGSAQFDGDTTFVNSTVTVIADPVISLGGNAVPTSSDSKDRGVEFFYWDAGASTGKRGFFGYSAADDAFKFLTSCPDPSGAEIFTGTAATVQMGNLNFVQGSGGQIQFNGTEKINIGANNIGLRKPLYGMTGTVDIGLSSNPFRAGYFSGTVNAANVEIDNATSGTRGAELTTEDNSSDLSGSLLLGAYHSEATRGPRLDFRASRGTKASPTNQLGAGEDLGRVEFHGYGGGGFRSAGGIEVETDGSWATNFPSRLKFFTHPNSNSALTATAMTIDSSQRVGIGTAAPSAATEITSSSDTFPNGYTNNLKLSAPSYPAMFLKKTGNDTGFILGIDGNGLNFRTESAGSSTARITINNSGSLGIGTTAPARKFHVNSGALDVGIRLESSDELAKIELQDNGGTAWLGVKSGGLHLQGGGSDTVGSLVVKDGNVGIGVAAPAAPLAVKVGTSGTEDKVFELLSNDDRALSILQPDNAQNNDFWTFATNNAYQFRVDAIDALTITHDGNVGIGVAAPTSILHVEGATPTVTVKGTGTASSKVDLINGSVTWSLENQYVGGATTNMFRIYNSSLSADALTINRATNNIGIGTTAPSELLHLSSATSHKPVMLVENTNADSSGAFVRLLKNTASPGVNDSIGAIQFQSNNDQGSGRVYAQIAARIHDPVAATATGELKFNTFVNGTDTTVMTMLDGRVGINNTSPLYTLDVTGGIRFSSSSVANGDLTFNDNKKANFGNSTDLRIYHDGTNSHVYNASGGGDLRLSSGGNESIRLESGGLVRVFGDLQVDGTTTTVSSTTVSIADPVFTLGGTSPPSSDDNKDRGIEFRYYDGSAKIGFMGWDDSTHQFRFFKDATNSSEVFSGTDGDLRVGALSAYDNISITGDKSILNQGDAAKGSIRFYDQSGGIIMLNGGTTNALRFDSHVKFLADKAIKDGSGNSIFQFYTSSFDGVAAPITRFGATMVLEGANAPSFLSRDNIVLRIDSNNDSTSNYFSVEADAGTELFRIKETGNVGIGTSSPSGNASKKTLHINDDSHGAAIRFSQGSNSSLIRYDDTAGLQIGTIASKDVILEAGDAEFLRLDASASHCYFSKSVIFNDNIELKLGTGNDLNLFSDGSNSTIRNQNQGNLNIKNTATGGDIVLTSDNGSGGTTDYLQIDGGSQIIQVKKDLYALDNIKLRAGNSGDLQIQHNGTDSFVQNATGDLIFIQNADAKDIIFQCDNGSGGTATYLTIDGSTETTKFYKGTKHLDSVVGAYGDSSDLLISHTGSLSRIQNSTGHFEIINSADAKDIIFQSDDGSGGVATYLTIDGSQGFTTLQKHLTADDNVNFQAGTDGDLRIYFDGSNGNIANVTGDLVLSNGADDRKIFVRGDDGSGGVTDYMTFDGYLGFTTIQKRFRADDSVKIEVGGAGDLFMSHDGTDSEITNQTGDLHIKNTADAKDIIFKSDDGSGNTTEYLKLDGNLVKTVFSKPSVWLDNQTVQLGNAADLQLYHDGSHSRIYNATGNLVLRNTGTGDVVFQADDGSGSSVSYLSLDASNTNISVSKSMVFADGIKASFGASSELQIQHNGTDSYIDSTTGNLRVTTYEADKDTIFSADNGSGGTTPYMTIDGSREEVVASKPLVQTPGTADPANNGELVFTVASDTSIKIKYRGSDGTLRSTTLTLS